MAGTGLEPVAQINHNGPAPVVLLCEHASNHIPECYGGLGLDEEARNAHIAWDIGALDVARGLAEALDAPLVHGTLSRLLYDCNRPLKAADAIPARSEVYTIPGNENLSPHQRKARYDAIHTPFHDAAAAAITARMKAATLPAVVTIHSFTPTFNGTKRDLDLGFLYHDTAATLAKAALAAEHRAARYTARLNEPYDMSDGVTYSLERHAVSRRLPSVMIEIRNDLIDTPERAANMAAHLAQTLREALATLPATSACAS